MKTAKTFMATGLLLSVMASSAQQFEKVNEVDLPDGFQGSAIHWVDMDHDGLLDLVVLAAQASENSHLLFYKNVNGLLAYEGLLMTGMDITAIAFTDINKDSQVDIIVSGPNGTGRYTTALLNDGNFSFLLSGQPILQQSGTTLTFADLDRDGRKELILSGTDEDGPFLRIFRENANTWEVINDSIKVNASTVIAYDFSHDGVNDLFISGRLQNNAAYHAMIFNDGNIHFPDAIEVTGLEEVATSLADINYDGVFDVVLAGKDTEGHPVLIALKSKEDGFEQLALSSIDFIANQVFAADLDSDGKVDIHVYGKNESNSSFNQILLHTGGVESLHEVDVMAQRFGDADYDGDLDLVQLSGTNGTKIVQYENKATAANLFPGKPGDPVSAFIYNRLFLYWTRPLDDLTPQTSITYDITLQTESADRVSGDVDLLTKKRLMVSHGNNGTHNYALFKNIQPAQYLYHIQAVDNAHHAGENICSGSVSTCNDIVEENIIVCGNETAMLTTGDEALWFSFEKGFLGAFNSFEVQATTDTVFALKPQHGIECALITLFLIEKKDQHVKDFLNTLYACENEDLHFESSGNWPEVEWLSTLKGFISNEAGITYKVSQQDTVNVFLSDGSGCSERHRTAIQTSKPAVNLNGEVFRILKGEEVQLIASGGNTYSWQPPTGLTHANTAKPIASPLQTTEYTVTVTDSIGCTASAKVLVIVESSAFVPNLFTPNQDGKNDALRIYGLAQVKGFSFSMYNREGSLVYTTSDITEATLSGWDGTAHGVLQPAGVYFWKVKGEHNNGSKLLLNGKDSGSIVLIR